MTVRVDRRPLHGDGEAGFTLVELMVALTILAIGLFAIAGVIHTSLETVTGTGSRTRAVAIATREMEELRAIPYEQLLASSITETTQETETYGGRTFTITRTLEWQSKTLGGGTLDQAYKKAHVVVTWTDTSGPHTVEQSTIVYPGGLGPAATTASSSASSDSYPPAPTTLSATSVTTDPATQVDLAWTPGVGTPAADYWVIEYTGDGWITTNRLTSNQPATELTYRVTGLSASTTYSFRVAAITEAGKMSSWSPIASLTTSASLDLTCQVGLASVTPSATKRQNSSASAGITDDLSVAVNSTGPCNGLYVRYAPSSSVTKTLFLTSAAGTWTGFIDGQDGTEWEKGQKEFVIYDSLGVRYGQVLVDVCAHNAKTCP